MSNDFVIAMFIFQLVPHGHTIAHEAIAQLILIGRFNFSLVRRFLGGSSFFNRVIFNRSSYRFLWVLFRGSSLFCCFDAGLLRCKHRLLFFPEQRIGSLLVGFHRIQRLSSDGIISVIRQRHLGKRLKRIKDGLHPFRVGQLCLYLLNAFLEIRIAVSCKGPGDIGRGVPQSADDLPGHLFSFVIRHDSAIFIREKPAGLNEAFNAPGGFAPRPINTGIRRANGSVGKRQSFPGIERIVVSTIRTAVFAVNVFHVRFPRFAFRVGEEEGIDTQPVMMIIRSALQQMIDLIVGNEKTPLRIVIRNDGEGQGLSLQIRDAGQIFPGPMVMQTQNLPVLHIGVQESPHFLFQIMKGRWLFQQFHHLGRHFGITAVGVVHIADGG